MNSLDCETNGALLLGSAMIAEKRRFAEIFHKFDAAAKDISKKTVESANFARELGLLLQGMCGHQQITFGFWRTHGQGQLPCDFNTAKILVSIANKMEAPAKTLNDAAPFVLSILQADGILALPEREVEQRAATISVFQKVLANITLIRAGFKKALRERPMEEWDGRALDSFLSETRWIAEERERALEYRKGK